MAEKENEKRKLKAELDKVRKQRDLLEQKVPNLDTNISELQTMVDKMSRETEKEQKRREQAIKDKDAAVEKLRVYAAVYDALKINEPEKFLQDYESVQTEVLSLTQKMAEKQK